VGREDQGKAGSLRSDDEKGLGPLILGMLGNA
jgi:hypothetical protein